MTMSDWVKIGIPILGIAIVMWAMVQQHEYRLDQIEHDFAAHLDKHDAQNAQTNKLLHDLEMQLVKLTQALEK